MSRSTPPCGGKGGAGNSTPSGSPKTPRGSSALSERVNFFEQMWSRGSSRSASMDDLQRDEIDGQGRRRSTSNLAVNMPRSSSRASNSSFEESFERLVEEGELNGAKVLKGFRIFDPFNKKIHISITSNFDLL